MFENQYVPKTNQRFKLMVGFQFHLNYFNGVEKIVNEKNDNIHLAKPPRAKIRPN